MKERIVDVPGLFRQRSLYAAVGSLYAQAAENVGRRTREFSDTLSFPHGYPSVLFQRFSFDRAPPPGPWFEWFRYGVLYRENAPIIIKRATGTTLHRTTLSHFKMEKPYRTVPHAAHHAAPLSCEKNENQRNGAVLHREHSW